MKKCLRRCALESSALRRTRADVILQERQHAKSLFLTEDGKPTSLASQIANTVVNGSTSTEPMTKSFEPGSAANENKGRLLTAQDKARIKQAIEAATTLEEVCPHRIRLEVVGTLTCAMAQLLRSRGCKEVWRKDLYPARRSYNLYELHDAHRSAYC